MRTLVVRPGPVGLFAFLLYVLFLASSYFGSVFYVLFVTVVLLASFSVVSMVSTVRRLEFRQSISTPQPSKGDAVEYRFTAIKQTAFPAVPARVEFTNVRHDLPVDVPEARFYPSSNHWFEFAHVVPVPYRGEYAIGVRMIEVTGFFHLLSYRIAGDVHEFAVYPRVVSISRAPFVGQESALSRPGLLRGRDDDPTILESLVQYREGLPIRHIAWKKFAAMGVPVLKTYGSSSRPGVTIYLDTRRYGVHDESSQAAEDCSIEILVALVKFYSSSAIPVAVYGDGLDRFEFDPHDDALFHQLLTAMIRVRFESTRSPAELFYADSATARFRSSAVLFITQQMDPEILTLAEFGTADATCSMVLNLAGRTIASRSDATHAVGRLRERGALVHIVRDTDTIKEDLEQ